MSHHILFPIQYFTLVPCLILIWLFNEKNIGQEISDLQSGVSDWLVLQEVFMVVYVIKEWLRIFTKVNRSNGGGGNDDFLLTQFYVDM